MSIEMQCIGSFFRGTWGRGVYCVILCFDEWRMYFDYQWDGDIKLLRAKTEGKMLYLWKLVSDVYIEDKARACKQLVELHEMRTLTCRSPSSGLPVIFCLCL